MVGVRVGGVGVGWVGGEGLGVGVCGARGVWGCVGVGVCGGGGVGIG